MRRRAAAWGAMAAAVPLLAVAAAPATVVQRGRAFGVAAVEVAAGTAVRFENADAYPHQITVSGPGMAFESDLQGTGERVEVPFPVAGVFDVRCGIHPRMRMVVRVQRAP